MISGSSGISLFWGIYNQIGHFSLSCMITGDIGLWENVGSDWANVFVSFILRCINKNIIRS